MIRTDLSISQLLSMDWEHDDEILKSLWFDWFCPDGQLVRRARKLMPRVAELAGGLLINKELYRVFFKNLYEPRPSGEDQIHIVPFSDKMPFARFIVSPPRRKGGTASWWHTGPDGKDGLFLETGTWEDVLDFFAVPHAPDATMKELSINLFGEIKPGKSIKLEACQTMPGKVEFDWPESEEAMARRVQKWIKDFAEKPANVVNNGNHDNR